MKEDLINERYRLIKRLGSGGMAGVYLAEDEQLNRQVAIKFIQKDRVAPEALPRMMERFTREAKAMSQFSEEEGIVTVHDYGEYEGNPYLVMELMDHGILKDQIGKPIAYQDAAKMLLAVVKGLEAIHVQGVIHRDIKPSNILRNRQGQYALGDFGIAKQINGNEHTLTEAGAGVGTVSYMAPEQWEGEATQQSDIYSMGVVLYELVTGRKPFEGVTGSDLYLKIMTEEIPSLRSLGVELPKSVMQVLKKALARDPKKRYKTAGELRKALERISEGKVGNSNWLKVVAIIGVVAVLLTGGWLAAKQLKGENEENQEATVVAEVIEETVTLKPTNTQTVTPIKTSTATVTSTPTITPTITQTPTATLGIVATRVREKDGMVQVYVPAGEFQLGYTDEQKEKLLDLCISGQVSFFAAPSLDNNQTSDLESMCSAMFFDSIAQIVYIDGFWIDQTEVTNSMYEQCRLVGGCPIQSNRRSNTRQYYYSDPEFANYPVILWWWEQADSYCDWVGGRLPTYTEWEKAARGTDGRLFSWGDEAPNSSLANVYVQEGDTTAVGSFPEGMSPYGAYDMMGNVSEFVSDYVWNLDYLYNIPYDNPKGPPSLPSDGIIQWFVNSDEHYAAGIQFLIMPFGFSLYETGFRCVTEDN